LFAMLFDAGELRLLAGAPAIHCVTIGCSVGTCKPCWQSNQYQGGLFLFFSPIFLTLPFFLAL
jgi:hypothetical protein